MFKMQFLWSSLWLASLARVSMAVTGASSPPATTPGPATCNGCYAVARLLQQIDFSDSRHGNTSLVLNLDYFTWNPAKTTEITNRATDINIPTSGTVYWNTLTMVNPNMHIYVPSWVVVAVTNSSNVCVETTIFTEGSGSLYNIPIPTPAPADFPFTAEPSIVSIISSSFGLLTCNTQANNFVAVGTVESTPSQTLASQSRTTFGSGVASQSGFSGSATAISSSAGTTDNSAAATTSASMSATASDSGLSQSAKIGIGVGVGLGGALVLALVAFILLKRATSNRHRVDGRTRHEAGVANDEPGVAVD